MSHQTEPTEDSADGFGSEAGDNATTAEPASTGNEEVDGALAALNDLDAAPLDEQVASYEMVHERLRGALDA